MPAAHSAVPASWQQQLCWKAVEAVSKFTHVNLPWNSTATRNENIREKIWRLQPNFAGGADPMASIYAADVGQPMDNFITSESRLKEWKWGI